MDNKFQLLISQALFCYGHELLLGDLIGITILFVSDYNCNK